MKSEHGLKDESGVAVQSWFSESELNLWPSNNGLLR